MSVNAIANSGRRSVYTKTQADTVRTDTKTDVSIPAHIKDEMYVSPEAREAMAKQAAASAEATNGVAEELQDSGGRAITFTSFAGEFSKVTQMYSDQIRDYYTKEHEENLTYDNPYMHIWDKYKNSKSPDFRADLSEDERAWAYDHELDLLNGGKHLQMANPYAFPNGAPTLADAAKEANQTCREQIDRALQNILTKNEIELPEGTSFTLTVDETYTIYVAGLEDAELTAALEKALNGGENGKNLYCHLKLNTPGGEPLGVDYANGHLAAVDPGLEWDDMGLREVKMQAGPAWTRYSTTYNPHQGPLSDKIMTLHPESIQDSQESFDRLCSNIRMGAQQAIEDYFATHPQRSLGDNYKPVDDIPIDGTPAPFSVTTLDGTVEVNSVSDTGEENAETTFSSHFMAIVNQLMAKTAIVKEYYAKQHAENMRFPDPYQHIVDKYINYNSPYFRSDLTEEERRICVNQEKACLYGRPLQTDCHDIALREDGGLSMHKIEINAINGVRNQISQSIDELLQKNGITLPVGISFKLIVDPYNYYVRIEGLEDNTLTQAIEAALNVGENGKRLYDHIEQSNPAHFGGPIYSQYFNADPWKRSLYLTVEELTGYDIRTLERHDGTFWTPDGKDLWSVLVKADSDGYYSVADHADLYRQLARDGWDSTPDAYRSLIYQDGTLHDPDVLNGATSESEWQRNILDEETKKWNAFLAGREETLRKEAADRAAGITSTSHFGPRLSNERPAAEWGM